MDAGDSIHVHGVTGSRSVFSPDLQHAYSRRSTAGDIGAFDHVLLPDRRTVSLSRLLPVGQPDLNPLALRDSAGRLVRHLRPNPGPTRRIRRLASVNSGWPGIVWVAESGQQGDGYLLMLVDSLGKVPQMFERRTSWWTRGAPLSPVAVPRDTIPEPATRIDGLRQNRNGHLVLLATQPRSGWKTVRNEDAHRNGNFFSVVEVLDLQRRQVIGRVRVPGYAVSIVDDARFATYHEDDDGIPHVQLWRLTVRSTR
jgi:hypothetical protein